VKGGPAVPRHQDSLDLLLHQDRRLERLLAEWEHLTPDGTRPHADEVKRAWRRGTVGKLIHEHAAIRLAAESDVVRCLRRVGALRMADVLDRHAREARTIIDHLDEHSRGMSALDLRYSGDFDRAVGDLRRLWRSEIRSDIEFTGERVRSALGAERSQLRSARHVTKHAPLHPSVHQHWYHRIALVEQVHSMYDHLRSFPTAESTVFADADLAQRFDAGD